MRSGASEAARGRGGRDRAGARRRAQRRREALEALEARTLLATLPAPIIVERDLMPSGGTLDNVAAPSNESDPVIAVDRHNPSRLVAAWVRFDTDLSGAADPPDIVVEAAYSTNGGGTWQSLGLGGNLTDPNTPADARLAYNRAIDPSVAFDAEGNAYILATHQNADGSSGALVLDKFDLSGGSPSAVFTNKIVYQWAGADAAIDASMAVDDGPAVFNDPQTGASQGNPHSGNVYVAWASNDAAPANVTVDDNYNPNRILLVSSSDGGQTFGGYSVLNDGGNFGLQRNARPRVAVSSGTVDGRIEPGRVTVVWDDFGSGRNADPPVDFIEADRPAAGTNVNYTVSGAIGDAVDPGSDPHTPTVTNFDFDVNPADPRFVGFTTLSDLNVRVALTHAAIQELRIELVAPDGTTVLLLDNQTNANGDADDGTGASGADLGVLNGIAVGTTFDQQATRSIVDFTMAPPARGAGAPFIGHFRPQQSLNAFNGRSAAQLSGTWTLRITDFRAENAGTLNEAEVRFRSGLGATPDSRVATTRVIGSITDTFGRASAATPTGIGPGVAIAQDNTLGSFSPYQGRLYVTYVDWDDVDFNPADNTDIYLAYSDDGGLSWTSGLQVNDDRADRDGFSEGDDIGGGTSLTGRPQFQPNVAVDQATGMLALSWYDTRHDAARARVATYLTTSIDGGSSFSDQVFANQPRAVTDAITGNTVVTEPIPDNQSGGNPNTEGTFGFGDDQGLAVHGGRIYPIWSSNLNGGSNPDVLRHLDIQVATAVVAAGPRVVDSTMGVVGLTDPYGNVVDPVNGLRTADGTPILAGFEVTFDRPVDPGTFDPSDVRVFYRDATAANASGGLVPVVAVVPLDLGPFGPADALGATRFRVEVVPRSGVGTYSYIIGPEIRDRIRQVGSDGNRMDQDADATPGEAPADGDGPGDVYAAPRPTTTGGGFDFDPSRFFDGPYDPDTLPLILSGPRAISSRVPGTPQTGDNLVLDRPVSAIDVTFDRDMAIDSFTGADVLRLTGRTGEVIRPTPFVGLDDRDDADDRAIPDAPAAGGTLPMVSTLEVPGDGTFRVADLDLRLDLAHGDLSQLTVELEGPDGTRVTLLDGLPGAGLVGTILDDDAPLSIAEGSSPYTGRFRPVSGSLSAFDGKELRGTWRLIVTDNVSGQTGTLRGWTMEVTPLPKVAPVFNATAPGGSQLLGVPIPDGGTIGSTLAVPPTVGSFTIAGLAVTLDITHARPQDLSVVLVGPGGIEVPLFAGVGGPLSVDFRNTTLDDAAETAIGQAPSRSFTGIYRPAGALSAFDGLPIQGTWTLRVVDAADPDATDGTLNSWSLSAVPEDPSATAARTFRVSFPTQRVGGTYGVVLGSDVLSRNGEALDTNTNAGVDLLRGTAAAAPTVPVVFPTADAPKALADGGVTTSVLTVPEGFLIADLNVRLNIAHAHVPDLSAVLIAPDGTRITLFEAVGAVGPVGERVNFTNTVLDDQATTPIQNGAAPFFGTFNPQQPLGVLNGTQARGTWALELTDAAGGGSGTLTGWSLEFRRPVPNTGLGEPVADRASLAFRVFRMDPGDPLSGAVWTPVGPSSITDEPLVAEGARQGYSGRVTAIAADPSDPSGNTVYIGAASGGVWRTTDFLTTDPGGPTWIPLTDFGPTYGVHIGSIAAFARNNDPNQTILLAATGEASSQYGFGSTGGADAAGSTTQGVGFLRSTDGGATWELLDSTDNSLPFGSRDHQFAAGGGTAAFQVTIDPTRGPAGEVIAYAAMSGPAGGLWRSLDAGTTWQRMRAGNATDVALDEFGRDATTGLINNVYVAFAGEGVFRSPNRGQTINLMAPIGVPQLRDARTTNNPAVAVTNLPSPNGAAGRITLARPSVVPDSDPNAAVKNILYQGWTYAVVSTAGGTIQGLYLTKDFGQSWTQLQMPTLVRPGSTEDRGTARPSNDVSLPNEYDAPGSLQFPNPQYTLSMVVDPNNPEVVYLGGTSIGQESGLIRIDASRVHDAHALIGYHHSAPDGGAIWTNTNNANSAAVVDVVLDGLPRRLVPPLLFPDSNQYTNLIRHPDAPFLSTSAILIDNIASFTNDGRGVRWTPYDEVLRSSPGDMVPSTSVHAAVALRDPLTGNSRLLFGSDQGIFSGVAEEDGSLDPGIGNLPSATYSRVGNLQIAQVYQGAARPTTLAAQLSGAMFYGMTQGNGYLSSSPDLLDSGVNWWRGANSGELTGADVAVDQQGRNLLYQYKSPSYSDNTATLTEFFQVNGVPRTFGLIQTGGVSDPQWPGYGPVYQGLIPMGRFAVNPLNGDQVVISSNAGRIFATTDQAVNWAVIGNPGDLGNSGYAPAVAYGAPDPAAPGGVGNLGNFIYAGTVGGRIFVTRTGGGSQANAWQEISAGLDGSAVARILTSPDRGSHAAYAVTLNGVYYTPDSLAPTMSWTNISGNLFSIAQAPFGDLDAADSKLEFLTSIQADWRYAIPEDFDDPASPRHPILYVAGNAGVYRSLDNGLNWSLFPTTDDGAPVDGGYLPGAPVTDLDMAVGRIDPTNGRPIIDDTSPNVLLASTFGRGSFAVRLAPQVLPGSLAFAAGSDSGASATDRVTNVVTPTIEGFSAQTAYGAVITIQLIDLTDPASPVIIGNGTTDEDGRFSIQVVEGHFLPDGSTDGNKVIGVQAIDQSGTRGNVVNFEFTLDTTAPLAPGRPDLQPGSDSGLFDDDDITSDTSPTFDVDPRGEPATTVLSLLRDGEEVASGPVDALSPTTALTDPGPVADGAHAYSARQVDLAGNVSEVGPSLGVTIDTVAPIRPAPPDLDAADDTGASNTDNVTANTRPRFNGITNDVGIAELLDGNNNVLGTVDVNGGPFTIRPDAPMDDGVYDLRFRITDLAGNRSATSDPLAVTIDTTAPDDAISPTITMVTADDTGVVGDRITRNRRPRFEGQAAVSDPDDPNTVELLLVALDGVPRPVPEVLASGLVQAGNRYLLQPAAELPEGVVTVRARVRDTAGNVADSPDLDVTIDVTGPEGATGLRLRPEDDNLIPGDNVTSRRMPVFEGTTEPNSTVELIDEAGNTLVGGASNDAGYFALSLPQSLRNGTITLRARARDAAGNQGGPSAPLTVRVVSVRGDLDGDGLADSASYRSSTTPGLWTVIPSGGSPRYTVPMGQAGDVPISGDFDGDGKADLALWSPSTATFTVRQSTLGLFQRQLDTVGDERPAVADYDGDGRDDLAIYNSTFGFFLVVFSGGGATIEGFGVADGIPVPADYDGDFKADFAVFDQTTATWTVKRSTTGALLEHPLPTSGRPSSPVQFGAPSNFVADPDVPVPGDYDGNGYDDLAVFRQPTAEWFIWYADADGLMTTTNNAGATVPLRRMQQFGGSVAFLTLPDVPTPGDYNGDGTTDLSIYRQQDTGQYLTWLSGSPAERKQIQLDPATGQPPVPFAPPLAGDLPSQSPLGYKLSGGARMHLLVGGAIGSSSSRSVGGAAQLGAPAPDLGRTALAMSSATPLAPPTQARAQAPTVDDGASGPLGPWATLRERLQQHRRDRLAALRAHRGS